MRNTAAPCSRRWPSAATSSSAWAEPNCWGQTPSGSGPAAAAERHRLPGPVLDAAAQDRTGVDAGGGKHTRSDRRARSRPANRHDGLARVEPVRPRLAQQPVRDVQRTRDVALITLRLLAHVEDLHRALVEQ